MALTWWYSSSGDQHFKGWTIHRTIKKHVVGVVFLSLLFLFSFGDHSFFSNYVLLSINADLDFDQTVMLHVHICTYKMYLIIERTWYIQVKSMLKLYSKWVITHALKEDVRSTLKLCVPHTDFGMLRWIYTDLKVFLLYCILLYCFFFPKFIWIKLQCNIYYILIWL